MLERSLIMPDSWYFARLCFRSSLTQIDAAAEADLWPNPDVNGLGCPVVQNVDQHWNMMICARKQSGTEWGLKHLARRIHEVRRNAYAKPISLDISYCLCCTFHWRFPWVLLARWPYVREREPCKSKTKSPEWRSFTFLPTHKCLCFYLFLTITNIL